MPTISSPVKTVLCLVPCLGLLALCVGAALQGCNSSNTWAIQLDDVQASLQRIEKALGGLRQGIPDETEQRLRKLECVLNDAAQWPKEPDGADKLRQDLDDIVQTLPPLAAERIMPQLVRLNWAVEGLWNLRMCAGADATQLDEVQVTIKEVLDRHPRGHFKELHLELQAHLNHLQPRLRQFQLQQLLERASRALADNEDASAVHSSLDEFRGEREVAAILVKLRMKVLEKTGSERLIRLDTSFNKTRSFADERTRQVSLLNIQDDLLRLLVDLQLEEVAPKELTNKAKSLLAQCDQEWRAIAAKQQEENGKKLRRYQAWALKQIREFDSPHGWHYDVALPWVRQELTRFKDTSGDEDWEALREFPSIKELLEKKLNVDLSEVKGAVLTDANKQEIYTKAWQTIGWKNSIDTEIAYRATRDGMVKFLLPIQPQLLDPPLVQLYQQAFSKGWQKLEGREDQLFLAQQAAIVPKKTLEEIINQAVEPRK